MHLDVVELSRLERDRAGELQIPAVHELIDQQLPVHIEPRAVVGHRLERVSLRELRPHAPAPPHREIVASHARNRPAARPHEIYIGIHSLDRHAREALRVRVIFPGQPVRQIARARNRVAPVAPRAPFAVSVAAAVAVPRADFIKLLADQRRAARVAVFKSARAERDGGPLCAGRIQRRPDARRRRVVRPDFPIRREVRIRRVLILERRRRHHARRRVEECIVRRRAGDHRHERTMIRAHRDRVQPQRGNDLLRLARAAPVKFCGRPERAVEILHLQIIVLPRDQRDRAAPARCRLADPFVHELHAIHPQPRAVVRLRRESVRLAELRLHARPPAHAEIIHVHARRRRASAVVVVDVVFRARERGRTAEPRVVEIFRRDSARIIRRRGREIPQRRRAPIAVRVAAAVAVPHAKLVVRAVRQRGESIRKNAVRERRESERSAAHRRRAPHELRRHGRRPNLPLRRRLRLARVEILEHA